MRSRRRRFTLLSAVFAAVAVWVVAAWIGGYSRGFATRTRLPGGAVAVASWRSTVYVGVTWKTPDNGWSGTDVYQPAPAPIGNGRLGFRWEREGDSVLVGLPMWLVAGVLLSGAWMLGKRGAPPPPGLCPTCGYDLRASPDRCPECGTAVVGSTV